MGKCKSEKDVVIGAFGEKAVVAKNTCSIGGFGEVPGEAAGGTDTCIGDYGEEQLKEEVDSSTVGAFGETKAEAQEGECVGDFGEPCALQPKQSVEIGAFGEKGCM